jgi:ABC-type transporter Mla subunit MlaD
MALDFDDLFGTARVLAAIGSLRTTLNSIESKLGVITMTEQAISAGVDTINAVLSDVQDKTNALVTDAQEIQAELAAGQPLSQATLDKFNALVTTAQSVQTALDPAVDAVTALATPASAPADGGTPQS